MNTAILHYSAPPVIGGVETVIQAHAGLLNQAGYPLTVIAGRGRAESLPEGVQFKLIPEMDSQHPLVMEVAKELERGQVPPSFEKLVVQLEQSLYPVLKSFDNVMIHNIFTKHFNLPLTVALYRILDRGGMQNWIAWCHDITWTSPHSQSRVHPGYPWDLLRTFHPGVTYVTVSQYRQKELADLYHCPKGDIHVIYNGVDPNELLNLSGKVTCLLDRLGLWESDLILLMPVRITQAKNIEYAEKIIVSLKLDGYRPKLIVTGPPDPHDPEIMHYYQTLLELRKRLQIENEIQFIYELGPEPGKPFLLDEKEIGSLYRISDALLMPSLREGFGIPILEAGLTGIPVITTPIPAAEEIGANDMLTLSINSTPAEAAGQIIKYLENNPIFRLRRRIRESYSWKAIFNRDILPILVRERKN